MAMWLFIEGAIMAVYGHSVPGGFQKVSTVTWIVPGSAPSKAVIACSYLFIATCELRFPRAYCCYHQKLTSFA